MKADDPKPTLRCAVYTRVSTENGLDQEFNSLDNQRGASEAYIKSQAHEGWRLIRTRWSSAKISATPAFHDSSGVGAYLRLQRFAGDC